MDALIDCGALTAGATNDEIAKSLLKKLEGAPLPQTGDLVLRGGKWLAMLALQLFEVALKDGDCNLTWMTSTLLVDLMFDTCSKKIGCFDWLSDHFFLSF